MIHLPAGFLPSPPANGFARIGEELLRVDPAHHIFGCG
jgi:hypothetical protein